MTTYYTLSAIDFRGKHSVIIDKLSASNEELQAGVTNPPLFTRVLDTYLIAGLIGVINDRKSTIDKTGPERSYIYTETVQKHSPYIDFLASIPIILTQNMNHVTDIKRAFFCETNEEENYMLSRHRLFYEYALGGLELLEEKVLKSNSSASINPLEIFENLDQYLEELENKFKIENDFADHDLILNATELDFSDIE